MVHVFIVNSILVKQDYASELRNKLLAYKDIEGYVFTTHAKEHEKSLTETVLRTFDNERVRIYAVGGFGTIHNIINSIDDFSRTEIAWMPTYENSFIKSIVEDDTGFYDFESMLKGDAYPTDILKVNDIYSLNAFSIGIDTNLISIAQKTKELGFLNSKIPYALGLIHSVSHSQNQELIVEFEDKKIIDKFTEIFFGNGKMLGASLYFGKDANVFDGLANYRILGDSKVKNRSGYVKALKANDTELIDSFSLFGKTDSMRVSSPNGEAFFVNTDGELTEGNSFEVAVLPGKLNFVYPKGARNEQ